MADSSRLLLQTDTTPIIKANSPTLPNRTYVAIPNVKVKGNKPIDIGYEASFINLSIPESKWSLPLAIGRVDSDETSSQKALCQLESLLGQSELGLSEYLCLNTLDSKYGNAAYLAPAFVYDSLVSITRFRSGMKVWTKAKPCNDKGAPKVFGEKYYLNLVSGYKTYKHPKTKLPHEVYQRSIFELPTDDYVKNQDKKWTQYLPENKNIEQQTILFPTQARRAAQKKKIKTKRRKTKSKNSV